MRLDDARLELVERPVEREVARGDAALQHGQRGLPVRPRQRARLRHCGVHTVRGGRELAQERRRHPRQVGGQEHAELCAGQAQAGGHPDDGSSELAPVVEHGKGERQRIGRLPHRDDAVERLPEDAVGALGEGLVSEPRERLRRPEPPARASHEEDARYAVTRHGSE